jgi:hypothetical protein
MGLIASGSVVAFADRRLLHLDASGHGEDDLGEADMTFEGTRLSPMRLGCLLRSEEEGPVTVEMAIHDGPTGVREGSETCTFGGSGTSVALRGLFGAPHLVLTASAEHWRMSARFWKREKAWLLVLWPEAPDRPFDVASIPPPTFVDDEIPPDLERRMFPGPDA